MLRPALRVDAKGERLRLLDVHAHPDDESSKGAATTAKYVAEGVDVIVATCTGGERGSILNPAMDRPDILANIADIRRQEMDRAREILGVRAGLARLRRLGSTRGRRSTAASRRLLRAVPSSREAVAPLVKVIRSFQPHVMTTYDESDGGYPHPDHVMCHKISVAAFDGPPTLMPTPNLAPSWQPLKLYYSFTFHRERTMALRSSDASPAVSSRRTPSGFGSWPEDPKHAARITTRIACAEYFTVRDRALLAHSDSGRPGRTVVRGAA